MPFFNRLSSTPPSWRVRTNAAVIPSAVYTSGFAKWRVVFEEEFSMTRQIPSSSRRISIPFLSGKFASHRLIGSGCIAAEAWLAAIPRRVGYRGHFRSMLLTQIIDEPQKKKAVRPKHQADRY